VPPVVEMDVMDVTVDMEPLPPAALSRTGSVSSLASMPGTPASARKRIRETIVSGGIEGQSDPKDESDSKKASTEYVTRNKKKQRGKVASTIKLPSSSEDDEEGATGQKSTASFATAPKKRGQRGPGRSKAEFADDDTEGAEPLVATDGRLVEPSRRAKQVDKRIHENVIKNDNASTIELTNMAAKAVGTLKWLAQVSEGINGAWRKDLWEATEDLGTSLALLCKRVNPYVDPLSQSAAMEAMRVELAQVRRERDEANKKLSELRKQEVQPPESVGDGVAGMASARETMPPLPPPPAKTTSKAKK
jgi:hypothetical protein